MKEFFRKKLSEFWYKRYRTVYGEGGCSTCGPYSIDVIDESAFNLMLDEMDKWIEEEFNVKS